MGSTLTKPAAVLYVYHGACELSSCVAVLPFCFSSCVALDLHPLCVLCCCVPILAVKRSLFWFWCFLSLSVFVVRNLFPKDFGFRFPSRVCLSIVTLIEIWF